VRVKVVSYNIYWWNAFGQNPANGRKITDNIRYTLRPDVLGLQECDSPSLIQSRTGYARASTFSGSQGVMVRPGLFTVGDEGSRDIGATGKWGPRYVTWAQLTHRQSGRTFWHFNTHWCVHSGNGQKCSADKRYTGARNMLRVVRERAGGAPVIITGDFNAGEGEKGVRHFLENGYSMGKWNWVDGVLYSTAHWRTRSAGTGEKAGSDHRPVVAELELK
jgi:endonuclease/exonuclease/phosphatase family metal-dependent hydrolase